MGNMKEIGLLDCEDRPSVEENFKRVRGAILDSGDAILDSNGKLKNEVLPEGYPYDAGSFYYDNSVFKDGDEIISDAYFKVSDDTPSYDELMGATITLPDGEILVDENVLMYVEGEMCAAGEYCLVVYKDNVSVGGQFTLPSAGVYMLVPSAVSVSVSKDGIVPLDPKFLPEGIGGGDMLSVAIVYDGSKYVCNKTFEEVYSAIFYNRPIYAIYTDNDAINNLGKSQSLFASVQYRESVDCIWFVNNAYINGIVLYPDNTVSELAET